MRFSGICGEDSCEPNDVFVAATVDQGGNMVNAFRNLGVPVLVCTGHRLNTAIKWSLGIAGTFTAGGGGTCKNAQLRSLLQRASAMVGVFSRSPVSNDEFKSLQREMKHMNGDIPDVLELIQRNDTRYVVHLVHRVEHWCD